MQNKYYTYIHIYENEILTFGVGTYYANRKTHKQKYERAYQKSSRGYQKKGINHKDVKVYLFGNFDTKKEAEMYEIHLHDKAKEGKIAFELEEIESDLRGKTIVTKTSNPCTIVETLEFK